MNNHKKICKELYDYYAQDGICVKCGAVWSLAGHVLCGECAKKANYSQKKYDPDGSKKRERMRKLREKRIELGLCIDCGDKAYEGHRRCKKCLKKSKGSSALYKIKNKIHKGG